MFAARNPSLCSKECLCLYVCPTGATSTEDGTIDASKCIDGCRLCVDVCPEHAIYLIPERYPKTPAPEPSLLRNVAALAEVRAGLRSRLASAATHADNEVWTRVLKALELSSRILGEDCVRATGQLTPQVGALTALIAEPGLRGTEPESEPGDGTTTVTELLGQILAALQSERDAQPTALGVCTACGAIYTSAIPETCRRCTSGTVACIP